MKREEVFVNRELRWLTFNERVLQAAENPATPVLERLKFIGIFSSNLDEFYSVRVGSLHRMLKDPENHPAPPGTRPTRLMKDILAQVQKLTSRVDAVFTQIVRDLKSNSIFFVNEQTITPLQAAYIDDYFTSSVRNRLFPIMLDEKRPLPYLKHVTIYLAVSMYTRGTPEDIRYSLIEVPTDMLPRYIRIPSRNNKYYYIILDDIIRLKLKEIFSTLPYDTFDAYTIKITRDAEYDLTGEVTKSLYEKLSKSLRQRKMGDPVRVVYDRDMPKQLTRLLIDRTDLHRCRNIIAGGTYHNARDMINFPKVNKPECCFPSQPPLDHHSLRLGQSMIQQVIEQDHMIHLPYQRFDYIIDLLREAALDPTVSSIKMTLYRVANDSSVINALRNAARNGKKVIVFIELQARFDEKANMYWTEKLSREPNVTLISGLEGFKVHSKIGLITRKVKKKKTRVAMIGTGNFNESTGRLYTDHILLTADAAITSEVNRVFKVLRNSFFEPKFRELIVSPHSTRKRLSSLIKQEIRYAAEGREAGITIKINNLVDEKFIKLLARAIQTGVRTTLLIRGIFSLTVSEKTAEYVTAKAVIDRYLEHTRIYRFENGGEPLVYIGSADLMIRNLDNRIEVLTPVHDPMIKKELDEYLKIHTKDTYASYSLFKESLNSSLYTGDEEEPHAQKELYEFFRKLTEEKKRMHG